MNRERWQRCGSFAAPATLNRTVPKSGRRCPTTGLRRHRCNSRIEGRSLVQCALCVLVCSWHEHCNQYCHVTKKGPMKRIFIATRNNSQLDRLLVEPRSSGNNKLGKHLVRPRRCWRRSIKALLAVILTVLLTCASSRAQTSQPIHKPSSELQKEGDYYVGNWKLTGETKTSPFGPGGQKFESSERLERMPGGFFLLARSYEGEKWT